MRQAATADGVGSKGRRVEEALRSGLRHGRWAKGEKIPSVRAMAEELGVHRLTVLKGYRLLEEEGLLESSYRSGYYVRMEIPSGEASGSGVRWSYGAEAGCVAESRLAEIHGRAVRYRMSEALLDPTLLPNRFLAKHAQEVIANHPLLLSTYSTVMGDEELREAMAGYMRDRRLELSAEELMVTTGAQQGIDLAFRALLQPGDKALIERPTYSPAIDLLRQRGVCALPVDIRPDGYDLEQVENLLATERPKLFYLNPTFHNPTGYTVPVRQRKALLELAERYRCILVEDDAYSDLYFREPPPPPLFAYDTEGWVIYLRSYSKYIAPGLRIAFLAARPPLLSAIRPLKALSDGGTPLLGQKLFQSFFFSSRMQEHLAKLRVAVSMRKEAMERALSPSGWSWESPAGGLNLWVRLPQGLRASQLLEHSLELSAAFVPGPICDPLEAMHDRIRLSYSMLDERRLGEGVAKVIEAAEGAAAGNG
ncbi:PLP-dependent aminotransferase family protein [Paenibacillus albicereus]|uniref:PLP-dependent aminotransferase family protein n=1 Tax=Paenibacillus albicereus TaxID=2726185 RepID=A0A6H2GXS2_9BACL|nr:PLP-dependent aminotransferase family protein [Paenibacillus albicereus]QJC51928.1 PLP-dependent aminotransferase family protein [Paenibacillus albicereus]